MRLSVPKLLSKLISSHGPKSKQNRTSMSTKLRDLKLRSSGSKNRSLVLQPNREQQRLKPNVLQPTVMLLSAMSRKKRKELVNLRRLQSKPKLFRRN